MTDLPITSLQANEKMTTELRQRHWERIKDALLVLKLGTGEQIAEQSGMDYHAVMRRISEMERLEMVYKPGGKIPTKSGRNAYQYAIRTETTVIPQPEQYKPTDTTAADIACSIIAKTKQVKAVQQSIFENL